jgi:hypothetical protein
MRTSTPGRAFIRAASLLATAVLPACASHVATTINACPCADGFICCDSGVCAHDQSDCAVVTTALAKSIEGIWNGYVENLAPGSDDSLRIEIAIAADNTVSDQVTIGHGPPPAPATDPNLPWPVDIDGGVHAEAPIYIPGFVYTAEDISWQARRLKFRIPPYEPWQPWCALQTSYPAGGGEYSCVPAGGPVVDANGNCLTNTDPPVPVGCGKFDLCDNLRACLCAPNSCTCGGLGVCDCEANGCSAGTEFMSVPLGYWFDVSFGDGEADGSVDLSTEGPDLHNVRLTRME